MPYARLPRPFLLVLPVLLLAAAAAPAAAEEVSGAYDVRHLLVQIPDFTDAPKLGVQSGASSGKDPAADNAPLTRAERVKSLEEWLRKAVRADERPTTSVSIDEHGELTLKGTEAAVARLTRLLDGLRQARATQITVEARQLALGVNVADLPDAAVADKLLTAMSPGRPAIDLTAADVDALLRTVQASADGSVVTAPRVTIFDRQRAYVLVANQRAFVEGYGEFVVNGKRVATDPNIGVVSTGVVNDIRGTVANDGRTVALEVKFQWARLLELKEETQASPDGKPLEIQVPVIESFATDRTFVVPDGQAVLTYLGEAGPPPARAEKADAGNADAAKGKQGRPAAAPGAEVQGPMFLLISASVAKTDVKPLQ